MARSRKPLLLLHSYFWHSYCNNISMQANNNLVPAFKVFKQGVTVLPITILRDVNQPFNFDFKISKYQFLGYTVTEINK